MAKHSRHRTPSTLTIVVITGLAVGVVGLIMLLLSKGGNIPTLIAIPRVGLTIQTPSAAIVVMVIGFATALIPLVLDILVDLASARIDARRNTGADNTLPIDRYVDDVFHVDLLPDPIPTESDEKTIDTPPLKSGICSGDARPNGPR
jgi:hypothetical protein